MISPKQFSQNQEQFRQTGKFKPIGDHLHSVKASNSPSIYIQSLFLVHSGTSLTPTDQDALTYKWWRLYLEELTIQVKKNLLEVAQSIMEFLLKLDQFSQIRKTDVFLNSSFGLLQRVRTRQNDYTVSFLDHNCLILQVEEEVEGEGEFMKRILRVKCYRMIEEQEPHIESNFIEPINIRVREDFRGYFLKQRAGELWMVKGLEADAPAIELTEQGLEESECIAKRQIIIIRQLSQRILLLKFDEEVQTSSNKPSEPLELHIPNLRLYDCILMGINRRKLAKYRIQDQLQGKQWHSFDQVKSNDIKNEAKTVTERPKGTQRPQIASEILQKFSNPSTNVVEHSHNSQCRKTTKYTSLLQQKHLKISQRVITNPKESNLVPSDIDYPVSMKDEKQKDTQYFDEFQNLLYEEEGLNDQKQLTLNDSFQEFEKKEQSAKDMQIMKELSKRKQKENQEKKVLDLLKERIKDLINEEKEWINKNLKIKIEIKKLKNQENNNIQQNRQIQQVRSKIAQLKIYQRHLNQELGELNHSSGLEALVFGNNQRKSGDSSQSQRSNEKNFQSVNFGYANINMLSLTTSVKSNGISMRPPVSILSSISGTKSSGGNSYNQPQPGSKQSILAPQKSSQNVINQSKIYYGPTINQNCLHPQVVGRAVTPPILINNDYAGYPPNTTNNTQYYGFNNNGSSNAPSISVYPPGQILNPNQKRYNLQSPKN